MDTARRRGRLALAAVAVGAALALAGCASGDPLDERSEGGSSGGSAGEGSASDETIIVGSQGYYSNEIVAEIYAQALEDAGFTVERQFQIGQRDAYIPALESGEVNVFPEYSGNLLQFYDPETQATSAADVYAALQEALPDTLQVLEPSEAQDQDTYTVTRAFADQYGLESIADLAEVDVPLILGGNPELQERPYGPQGAQSVYGVTIDEFQATGDTTVDALVAGTINVGDVYSADPRISSEDLVTLDDPEEMILVQNVVPVVSAELAEEVVNVLNPISAALDTEQLIELNVQSVDEKQSSEAIASAWLEENGLLG